MRASILLLLLLRPAGLWAEDVAALPELRDVVAPTPDAREEAGEPAAPEHRDLDARSDDRPVLESPAEPAPQSGLTDS